MMHGASAWWNAVMHIVRCSICLGSQCLSICRRRPVRTQERTQESFTVRTHMAGVVTSRRRGRKNMPLFRAASGNNCRQHFFVSFGPQSKTSVCFVQPRVTIANSCFFVCSFGLQVETLTSLTSHTMEWPCTRGQSWISDHRKRIPCWR